MPRVSIITPVYNATDEMFEKSYESVIGQTSLNKNFEWIIVDDGSNPDIYSRIRDITLDQNYGAAVARNIGFQISSGDIITYLDMGDELASDRVENLIKTFDENKCELLFSGYEIVEVNGQHYNFNPFSWIGNTMSAYDYLRLLQKQNISIPLGTAHTRKPFVECGGFQRGIVCGEDGILWRRMVDKLLSTHVLISDDMAGTYYVNPDGQSRTQRRPDMGGFAFDGNLHDNGKYLDKDWFETYSSEGYYD